MGRVFVFGFQCSIYVDSRFGYMYIVHLRCTRCLILLHLYFGFKQGIPRYNMFVFMYVGVNVWGMWSCLLCGGRC